MAQILLETIFAVEAMKATQSKLVSAATTAVITHNRKKDTYKAKFRQGGNRCKTVFEFAWLAQANKTKKFFTPSNVALAAFI